MGREFCIDIFFQIHPLVTASALYSIYVAFKKKDIRYVIISWLVILVFILQIKRMRYIIPVFPMFSLMASYGLQEIKDKELKRFVVSCIVISSLVISIFVYLPFMQKISAVNLKHAGEYLDSLDERNIEVFTLPQKEPRINPAVSVPIIDLFTKKRITYQYNINLPSPQEEIKKSSLRFTWEYKNPEYYTDYRNDTNENTVLVIISGRTDKKLPYNVVRKIKDYQIVKVFKSFTGVFQYKTIVTIYRPINTHRAL